MSVTMVTSGMRFGRLTVVKRLENKNHQTMWLCLCECGKETNVSGGSLRRGDTKSCGCYNREKTAERNTTHQKSKTRLYKIWAGMKKRCLYIKDKNYEIYGGRGIKVCEEWLKFEAFQDWALSNGYTDELTIDRKDSDGDYEPSNCRWATVTEQANNKRNNHKLTYSGETHTIREWAKLIGISYNTLRSRIQRGWGVGKALTILTEPKDRGGIL